MYSQDFPPPDHEKPVVVHVTKVRMGWSLVFAAVSILAITVVAVTAHASMVGLMALAAVATCAGVLIGAEVCYWRAER